MTGNKLFKGSPASSGATWFQGGLSAEPVGRRREAASAQLLETAGRGNLGILTDGGATLTGFVNKHRKGANLEVTLRRGRREREGSPVRVFASSAPDRDDPGAASYLMQRLAERQLEQVGIQDVPVSSPKSKTPFLCLSWASAKGEVSRKPRTVRYGEFADGGEIPRH